MTGIDGFAVLVAAGALAGGSIWFIRSAQRARDIRALAEKIGFHYLSSELPRSLSLPENLNSMITSVWNVIDGASRGMRVVAFDCRIRSGKGSCVRTVFAAQTSRTELKKFFFGDCVTDRIGEWTFCYEPRSSGMIGPGLMPVSEMEAVLQSVSS